jgi:hypothetical protein
MAAHTPEDIDQVVRGVEKSIEMLTADGVVG